MDLTELINVVSASSLQLQTVEQSSDDTSDAIIDTSFNLVQSLQRLQNLEKCVLFYSPHFSYYSFNFNNDVNNLFLNA